MKPVSSLLFFMLGLSLAAYQTFDELGDLDDVEGPKEEIEITLDQLLDDSIQDIIKKNPKVEVKVVQAAPPEETKQEKEAKEKEIASLEEPEVDTTELLARAEEVTVLLGRRLISSLSDKSAAEEIGLVLADLVRAQELFKTKVVKSSR